MSITSITSSIASTILAIMFSVSAYAATMSNAAQTYSGTGAGRGGFVNSTGFVKERNDEQDHMDGKESPEDAAKESTAEPEDGDVPRPAEDEKQSSSDKVPAGK